MEVVQRRKAEEGREAANSEPDVTFVFRSLGTFKTRQESYGLDPTDQEWEGLNRIEGRAH